MLYDFPLRNVFPLVVCHMNMYFSDFYTPATPSREGFSPATYSLCWNSSEESLQRRFITCLNLFFSFYLPALLQLKSCIYSSWNVLLLVIYLFILLWLLGWTVYHNSLYPATTDNVVRFSPVQRISPCSVSHEYVF